MTLSATGLGYTYAGGAAIGPVDLHVEPGERVLLSGPSGSGKTTLLRLLSGICARSGWGTVSGRVGVGGLDPGALAPRDRPRKLGFVGQDPKDQLVCGTAADEVAFGPECAGLPGGEVEVRISRELRRAGLAGLELRDPHALSTGQQQRLVTAAALAGGAGLLLLDEPLAHLDPDGADALLAHLRALSDDGIAVVLAEHRLRRVVPWATRQVELDGGRVEYDGVPREPGGERPAPVPRPAPGAELARGEGIVHAGVLRGVDLALRERDRVALLGVNGAGKSTLLGHLSGRIGGRGLPGALEVPQDPDLTLFCATVDAELRYGPIEHGSAGEDVPRIAAGLGLTGLLDRPPHGLSRGQRLRTAVGAVLACRPRILLLDEPTAGQDPDAVERVMAVVDQELGDGALLFATHDEDLARRWANRVVRLRDGRLHEEG